MNEITKRSVDAAVEKNKTMAKAASEVDMHFNFQWKVDEEWNTIIVGEHGWQAKARAEHLWKLIHPEHFDDQGFLDPHVEWERFSPMLTEFLEWKIEQNPDLQLTDYSDYLSKLFPKQLELF